MRCFSRLTAVILSFALTAVPITASTPVLGTVAYAQNAHVGTAAASAGTTVFPSDRLSTEELGSMQVLTGAARLVLPATSQAIWNVEEGAAAATLTGGTAIFSTATAKGFKLHASTATIRAYADGPTVGSVSIVNPKELKVSCSRGMLAISVDDDTKTVAQGKAYRVLLDPDSATQNTASVQGQSDATDTNPAQQKPKKAGKNRFVLVAILFSAAATAVILTRSLESPSAP